MTSSTTDHQEPSPPTTPILTLPRVILRPYHPSDAPHVTRHANDIGITKYMRNTFPFPYELHHAESFIANLAGTTKPVREGSEDEKDQRQVLLNYAICRRSDGAYIGAMGLNPCDDIDSRSWEIGYWLGREFWGQGYMSEVIPPFCEWSFRTFPDLLRIEARVFQPNIPSQGVLKKSGFAAEGLRRRAIWKNGEILDQVILGILREQSIGSQEAE